MYETHDKRALLLPKVTAADAGKVLAVDENGKLSLESIGSGLPEVSSSDAGMVLTVSEDGEWEAASAASELPEVTSSNAGMVLTVSEDGEWEAASPSGGGMTLYGPYYASASTDQAIPTSTEGYIDFGVINNADYSKNYSYNSECLYIISGIGIGSYSDLNFMGVYPPNFDNGSGKISMAFYNGSAGSVTVYAGSVFVPFYTTEPLSEVTV